jgi:cell filamentation protein
VEDFLLDRLSVRIGSGAYYYDDDKNDELAEDIQAKGFQAFFKWVLAMHDTIYYLARGSAPPPRMRWVGAPHPHDALIDENNDMLLKLIPFQRRPSTMANKISIRFFDDREVRAVWDNEHSKWWFSVLDIIGVLRNESDYQKIRNYWKYLKTKLKKENPQLVSAANQLKITAADGKKYLTDTFDYNGVKELAKNFPSIQANRFIEWFTYSDETIDGKSKSKAYAMFDSSLLDTIEVGTIRGLQQIHGYLFGGLYDFAGQIRTLNIAKDGFLFAPAQFLESTLKMIENMPDSTFDEIVDKYVEMNVAHPFMEGNGRSTRIWLDLIFKKNLLLCVDWSKMGKKEYLDAMRESTTNITRIKTLLQGALTAKINDREVFMKGIDYSYYYEQEDDVFEDGQNG